MTEITTHGYSFICARRGTGGRREVRRSNRAADRPRSLGACAPIKMPNAPRAQLARVRFDCPRASWGASENRAKAPQRLNLTVNQAVLSLIIDQTALRRPQNCAAVLRPSDNLTSGVAKHVRLRHASARIYFCFLWCFKPWGPLYARLLTVTG